MTDQIRSDQKGKSKSKDFDRDGDSDKGRKRSRLVRMLKEEIILIRNKIDFELIDFFLSNLDCCENAEPHI